MALTLSAAPIQPVSHIDAPGSASSYPPHLLKHMSSFASSESSVAAPEHLSNRVQRTSTSVSASAMSSSVNRPLPSLPRAQSVTRSSAAPTTMAIPTFRPPPKHKTLNSPVSYRSHFVSAMPQRKTVSSIATIVNHPGTLSRLLSFLPWPDFLALSQTCRSLRDIPQKENLRDVILSRYVEGYGTCLRLLSGSREGMKEVPVTLHDIDLLLISQRTPLHIYPTAALSTLSSRHLSKAEILRNQKLERLTHIHSRFVLLLQSLAHSSSLPPPSEPEPESDPIFPDTRTQSQGPSLLQRVSLLDGPGTGSVRELIFPAPLSCPDLAIESDRPTEMAGRIPQRRSVSAGAVLTDVRDHRPTPSLTSSASYLQSSRYRQSPKSTGLPGRQAGTIRNPDSSASLRSMKRKNRLSIFGNSSTKPPPPPADPRDLKYYSTGWRRSLANASFAHKAKRASSAHGSSVSEGWLSDDDLGFYRPHRRFASSNFSGSNHSFSSTSGSASGSGGSPLSRSERHNSPSPPLTPIIMPSPSSPHDLVLATSRVRAPILRVYVPCSELSDTPEFLDKDYFISRAGGGLSIQQCEDQLIGSGLWEHMSTGDVVCNLGYVPPAGNTGSEDSSVEEHSPNREFSRRRGRFDKFKETRTWLIFNGHCLVPFCPPEDLLPIDDPISLPSPFYYDYLIPATPLAVGRQRSPLAPGNIRMVIGRLPPPAFEEIPQLRLVHTQTRVPSPHSRGGVAVVRKWVWIARVWRGGLHYDAVGKMNGGGGGFGASMGIGWEGEWVVEGDGTKEGRQALLDCLNGEYTTHRECEFVREKSGGGRVWLRMLESSVQLLPTPSNFDSVSSGSTQTTFQ
ncbi:uncharacterized protein ARMOST_13096 [Armillaria ostoyae]|uniref:F-box domain-containing protein n=1 Tax=Armillaria ostoyae TaxID=47428 RepID=A0A284RLY6_ARMOS|nr:uncharacterized protein ARMOST_13096 [Armillaria ostoyae]